MNFKLLLWNYLTTVIVYSVDHYLSGFTELCTPCND